MLSTFQLKSIIDGVEHNRTEPNKTKLNRPMCWQSILVQCYQLLHLNENPFLFCYICFSKLFICLFSSLISLSAPPQNVSSVLVSYASLVGQQQLFSICAQRKHSFNMACAHSEKERERERKKDECIEEFREKLKLN